MKPGIPLFFAERHFRHSRKLVSAVVTVAERAAATPGLGTSAPAPEEQLVESTARVLVPREEMQARGLLDKGRAEVVVRNPSAKRLADPSLSGRRPLSPSLKGLRDLLLDFASVGVIPAGTETTTSGFIMLNEPTALEIK